MSKFSFFGEICDKTAQPGKSKTILIPRTQQNIELHEIDAQMSLSYENFSANTKPNIFVSTAFSVYEIISLLHMRNSYLFT